MVEGTRHAKKLLGIRFQIGFGSGSVRLVPSAESLKEEIVDFEVSFEIEGCEWL